MTVERAQQIIEEAGFVSTSDAWNDHQILERVGLSLTVRNYLARNYQLTEWADLARKNFIVFRRLNKETLNYLAVTNPEGLNWEEMLNADPCADTKEMKKTLKTKFTHLIRNIHKIFTLEISTIKRGKRQGWKLHRRKLGRDVKLSLKGEYIGEVFTRCSYLLSAEQLRDISKIFQLTQKDLDTLWSKQFIYKGKQGGSYYLYAKDARKYKQNWLDQIAFVDSQFKAVALAKRDSAIRQLIDNALLEKRWLLDKDYASILIDEVQRIHKDTLGNNTMKTWINDLPPNATSHKNDLLPPFHQLLFAHELTLKRASSDMRKMEAPLSSAMGRGET